MVACFLQDGFLERLTSNEFVCLSQTVDDFVTSTEQISGRRCTALRTTVQNQVQNQLLCAKILTSIRVFLYVKPLLKVLKSVVYRFFASFST